MLPVFIKDRWRCQILPSIRQAVGESRMPWELDQTIDGVKFEDLVEMVINKIYQSSSSYKVMRGTQIYVQVTHLKFCLANADKMFEGQAGSI
jgi:hypothetical protein